MFSTLKLPLRGRHSSATSCARGDPNQDQEDSNADVERHIYRVTPQETPKSNGLSSCPTSPLLSGKQNKGSRATEKSPSKWKLDGALCLSIGNLRDKGRWDDDDEDQGGGSEVCAFSKVTRVAIARENGCLGITLRGGASAGKPLIITSLRPGGPADREGSVRPGDRLLGVDGINLESADLNAAEDALRRQCGQCGVAVLTIEYSVCVVGAVVGATGPLLVELARPPIHQLGLSLATIPAQEGSNRTIVVVDAIKPASVVDRSGALRRGDQILAVDGVRVGTDLTAAHVALLLADYRQRVLRLEILPSHCNPAWTASLRAGQKSNSDTRSLDSILGLRQYQTEEICTSHFDTHQYDLYKNNLTRAPSSPLDSNLHFRTLAQSRTASDTPSLVGSINSAGASAGKRTRTPAGLNHTETVFAVLHPDSCTGYGLHVRAIGPTRIPVISTIVPDGPADRSGCLSLGDRVLAVDDAETDADHLAQLLNAPGPPLKLQVSFSVQFPPVPSSGVFSVDLPKSGGGLGITITASKSEDCLLISDIKRGSVAHRSGSLYAGDRLLSIGGLSLWGRSLDDVACILRATRDVVTLKVFRSASRPDPDPNEQSVEYTVELVRGSGPLGFTIAGSEDPTDSITISGLTKGGLAEKTGALHVGDQLLAINGEWLYGRSLSDAVTLFQNSSPTVTLRISRNNTKTMTAYEECPPSLSNSALGGSNSRENSNHGASMEKSRLTPGLSRRAGSCPSLDCHLQSEWDRSLEDLDSAAVTAANLFLRTAQNLPCPEDSPAISPPPSFRQTPVQPLSHCTTSLNNGERLTAARALNIDWQQQQEKRASPSQNVSASYLWMNKDRGNNMPHSLTDSDANDSLRDMFKLANLNGSSHKVQERSSLLSEEEAQGVARDLGLTQPMQIFQVTIYKDSVYEDFGFSVSDGLYERGVFINRIRNGGPADISGILKPYDRILQVNETRTHDLDCCLTVPLIASAGDRIHLVVARHPSNCINIQSWMEEERTQSCEPTTVTHTI